MTTSSRLRIALLSLGVLITPLFGTPAAHAATDNLVPNPSVETVGKPTSQPLSWNKGGWGTNTATYAYLKSGYTGNRSVKVRISSYNDGDAKWYFDPQSIVAGQYYEVSDYYKANVTTQVVVQVDFTNGTTDYVYLKDAPKSTTAWAHYTDHFIAPDGAKTMTVFHLLAAVGYLTTDDYSVTAASPSQFKRALVSVNFDDGWESIYTNALPLLNQYNIPSTQFIVSGFLTNRPGYMNQAEVQAFKDAGSEIGSHTISHPDLTTLNTTQLNRQLRQSQNSLQSIFGGPVNDFASPYGAYDNKVLTAIKKYYRSHRSTDEGYNSKDSFDVYNIKVQNIEVTTTPAQVQAWVDQAVANKTWLVLVYHQVDLSGDQYSVTPQNLHTELQAIKNSDITPLTNGQAIDEITSQL